MPTSLTVDVTGIFQEAVAAKQTEDEQTKDAGNALAIAGAGAFLLVPATVVMHFMDPSGVLAWSAIVVGSLGLILLLISSVVLIKELDGESEDSGGSWALGTVAIIAIKFVVDVWQYLT